VAARSPEDGRPLEGVLVADFSRILAGPLATMTLGDLGADVIKVESPGGDETRAWSPPLDERGRATYFLAVNRNKRSVVLDLRRDDHRRMAGELAVRADILVNNFKPGTLERFELDHESLAARHPGLIHCSITGFGHGAGASLPGYDPLVQALSGLMSVTGEPDREPIKVGVALVDVIAGLNAVVAILAALRARDRTGLGERIEINLMQSALAALVNQASAYLNAGVVPDRLGNVHPSIEPFATYATADDPIMICAGSDAQFAALAAAVGAPELATDTRFTTNAERVSNRRALRSYLESRLGLAPAGDWVERLRAAGVPAGRVNDIAGGFALGAALDLELIDERDGVRTPVSPLGLERTPPATSLPPPELDEHGEAIRRWLSSSDPGSPRLPPR
jgi:crotonobetainyl-CoA:carnitine CoA-transferase CaiB-like acyl-CoA transferase